MDGIQYKVEIFLCSQMAKQNYFASPFGIQRYWYSKILCRNQNSDCIISSEKSKCCNRIRFRIYPYWQWLILFYYVNKSYIYKIKGICNSYITLYYNSESLFKMIGFDFIHLFYKTLATLMFQFQYSILQRYSYVPKWRSKIILLRLLGPRDTGIAKYYVGIKTLSMLYYPKRVNAVIGYDLELTLICNG